MDYVFVSHDCFNFSNNREFITTLVTELVLHNFLINNTNMAAARIRNVELR